MGKIPASIKLYYLLKPGIPRFLQIALRRVAARRKLMTSTDVWPIDVRAAAPPPGWKGWPDGKKFGLILAHDVESQEGHEKCLRVAKLEEELGFKSVFNFVPERYTVSKHLRDELKRKGFEICVHGLNHDGKLFFSKKIFSERAKKINMYLRQWESCGFTSPSMHHNHEWMHELEIEHATSTFDTDPFEPQPDRFRSIFPAFIQDGTSGSGFLELPYTMAQDFTLFVILQQKDIRMWTRKLDWIVENGGMALVNTHPDYMIFDESETGRYKYPVSIYKTLLNYILENYKGQYWHSIPNDLTKLLTGKECARF